MGLIERLETFDRRWIFLAMGLAIVLPLLFPLGLPASPSPSVKANYYAVDELPEGSTVLVSIDLDPATLPELEPYLRASIKHLKKRNCKLVLVSLWYSAPPLIDRWIKELIEQPAFPGDRAYKKNVDYAWLGFREGKQAVIANMGQDLWATFAAHDADGRPFDEIPILQGYHRLADFPLIVLVSAGSPGAKEYVQQVGTRYGLHIVTACTAVSLTDLSPYYQAGQLMGLCGGMADTAQYEIMVAKLVGQKPGDGIGAKALDVLNIGHMVVILAIIFGNTIYFLGRRRAREGR